MAKCVVLNSTRNYSEEGKALLELILADEPDLVAVLGKDCEKWEDAMEWLLVQLDLSGGLPAAACNTTCHPGEDLATVVAFAEQWCDLKGWPRDVRVVVI